MSNSPPRTRPHGKQSADLSVIIVTWNRPHLLRACLHCLKRAIALAGLACEVWVVDNGSTAGDAEVVETEFPEVNLIRSLANLGFARANNLALRRARSRYYLLLNNDALVPLYALRAAVAFMEAVPTVGIAGAHLVDIEGNPEQSSGDIPTPAGTLADQVHFSTLLGWLRPLHAIGRRSQRHFLHPREVGYVSGAFLVIREETLRQIGLLDERFDFYYEEVDWCARARAAGWQVVSMPALRVLHHHGQDTHPPANGLHAVGLESRRRFLEKHYGRLAARAYRAAVPLGAFMLLLRSLLPGGAPRSQRFAIALSDLSWSLRGRQTWPP